MMMILRMLQLKCIIILYPGFKKLNVKLSDIEVVKQLKLTQEYKEYKKIQQKVLALENALIFELKDKLLNKTKGKKY